MEFVRSTEWPPNFQGLYLFNYHIQNKPNQSVYKNQREPFQSLELLQQKNENVLPLISQDVRSAIDQWKRRVQAFEKTVAPVQHRFQWKL
jgi:hypothetical protein